MGRLKKNMSACFSHKVELSLFIRKLSFNCEVKSSDVGRSLLRCIRPLDVVHVVIQQRVLYNSSSCPTACPTIQNKTALICRFTKNKNGGQSVTVTTPTHGKQKFSVLDFGIVV